MSASGSRFWRRSIVDSIIGLNNVASILDPFNARAISDSHDIGRNSIRRGLRLGVATATQHER